MDNGREFRIYCDICGFQLVKESEDIYYCEKCDYLYDKSGILGTTQKNRTKNLLYYISKESRVKKLLRKYSRFSYVVGDVLSASQKKIPVSDNVEVVGEVVIEVEGERIPLTLWGKWAETVNYLKKGMRIRVTSVKKSIFRSNYVLSTTSDSYVIVEPDDLISVTDLRTACRCMRAYLNQYVSGPTPPTYLTIRGIAVHKAAQYYIQGHNISSAIEKAIKSVEDDAKIYNIDITSLNNELSEHIENVLPVIENLRKKKRSCDIELKLYSPFFGLVGKIDIVLNNKIYEIKTAKPPEGESRFADKLQLACYLAMIKHRVFARLLGKKYTNKPNLVPIEESDTMVYETVSNTYCDGYLIYSGGKDCLKREYPTDGLFQFALRLRNRIVAIRHGIFLPLEKTEFCESCYDVELCNRVGRLFKNRDTEEADFFKKWFYFLRKEEYSAIMEFANLWNKTPEEREKDARAITDIEVTKIEQDEKMYIHHIRCRNLAEISIGDRVIMSRDGYLPFEKDIVPGIVVNIYKDNTNANKPDIIVVSAFTPFETPRVIDIDISLTHFPRLRRALFMFLTENTVARDIVLGRKKPEYSKVDSIEFSFENGSQREAIKKAVGARDILLIQGPPGTGKTMVISRIIDILYNQGKKILLTAYTNKAVDNILLRLMKSSEISVSDSLTRVGSKMSVDPKLLEYTVNINHDFDKIKKSSIVAATTATIISDKFELLDFDITIVDEAGQLSLPFSLAAVMKSPVTILVGDHKQLPPLVISQELREKGYDISLFEMLAQRFGAVMLDEQFRMNEKIMLFSSLKYYDGALESGNPSIASQKIRLINRQDIISEIIDPEIPVVFVNVESDKSVKKNKNEAIVIRKIVSDFVINGCLQENIGIISPFRHQVKILKKYLNDFPGCEIKTIDKFQGSEKDIIIISFTQSATRILPILLDERRLNVALTRAKKKLVLVGNIKTLQQRDIYKQLIRYSHLVDSSQISAI